MMPAEILNRLEGRNRLIKRCMKGRLYLLVTDHGYLQVPEVVWETLEAVNTSEYVDAKFRKACEVGAEENRPSENAEFVFLIFFSVSLFFLFFSPCLCLALMLSFFFCWFFHTHYFSLFHSLFLSFSSNLAVLYTEQ